MATSQTEMTLREAVSRELERRAAALMQRENRDNRPPAERIKSPKKKLTRQAAVAQVLDADPWLYEEYQAKDADQPLSDVVRQRRFKVEELKALAKAGCADWGAAVDYCAKEIAKGKNCSYVEALGLVRLQLPGIWSQYAAQGCSA